MYPPLNKVLVIDPSGELRDFLRFCAGRLWPKLEIVSYLWARGCPDETFDWRGFDIVVLEHRLHESTTSGIAWLRALKRNPALPPVVLVAGDLSDKLRRAGEAAGAAAVLDKDDLSPRLFAGCVADALRPPSSAREAAPAADPEPDDESMLAEEEPLVAEESIAEEPADLDNTATHVALVSEEPAPPDVPGFTAIRPISMTPRGWVIIATDDSTQHTVVLKTIRVAPEVDVSVLRSFSQDYTSLSYLRNNHVIRIVRHGFTQNYGFIATEHCPGGDLRKRIEAGISVWDAVDYLGQIMHGLNAVHARGILHRDIKPSNLVLREDGTLVMTDFGVEKDLSGNRRHGVLVDDVNYLSPEAIRYRAVDVRSDLYSAGVVLYEMLTGARPFTDLTPGATLEAHLSAPIPPLPPTSAVLQPLIDGLLAKDPNDRFQSAEDVLDGIDWLARAHETERRGSETAAGHA